MLPPSTLTSHAGDLATRSSQLHSRTSLNTTALPMSSLSCATAKPLPRAIASRFQWCAPPVIARRQVYVLSHKNGFNSMERRYHPPGDPVKKCTRTANIYAFTRHRNYLPPIYALNATWKTKYLLHSLWQYQYSSHHQRQDLSALLRSTEFALKHHFH